MTLVMFVGALGAWVSFWIIARGGSEPSEALPLD